MTFTFGGDQLVAFIMFLFLAGSVFGAWFERHHSGTNEEIEALEDEIESLQQEILRAEKDKDHLRELLWEFSQHPAIPHLLKDRQRANAKRIKSVK